MQKLFSSIEHKGVTVGHPVVDGWMCNSKKIICSIDGAVGHSCHNNKRNFSVHVGDNLVGYVHCMTGGQYVALDLQYNEIATYTGSDAEMKCFVEVVQHV